MNITQMISTKLQIFLCLNPFKLHVPLLYPLEYQISIGILMYPGGIEWEH